MVQEIALEIKFINVSGTDWKRLDASYHDDVTDRAVSTPGEILQGNAGQEVLSTSLVGSDVAMGEHENIYVGYQTPGGEAWLDVKIIVPTQVFHMGNSPYYEVRHASRRDWYQPPGGPGSGVTIEEGGTRWCWHRRLVVR